LLSRASLTPTSYFRTPAALFSLLAKSKALAVNFRLACVVCCVVPAETVWAVFSRKHWPQLAVPTRYVGHYTVRDDIGLRHKAGMQIAA